MVFKACMLLAFAMAIGGEVRSQSQWKTHSFPYLESDSAPVFTSRLTYGTEQIEDGFFAVLDLQSQSSSIEPRILTKLGLTGKYLELNTVHRLREDNVKVEIFPNTIHRFVTRRSDTIPGVRIGLDVLSGTKLTLDAQARKMTIRTNDQRTVGEQTDSIPPTINIQIGNASFDFELNVFQGFSLRISEATFAKIRNSFSEKLIPIDIASEGLEIYRLQRIKVGATILENVLAKVGGATDSAGLTLLNRFIVDIDEAGKVKLSPNNFNAFRDHSFNDGIMVEFRKNSNGIREEFLKKVLPGSAADRAGLKVGDQVVKLINDSGENIVETDNEYGMAGALLHLVPRTKPLPIEILRDGRKITLELESDMINKN